MYERRDERYLIFIKFNVIRQFVNIILLRLFFLLFKSISHVLMLVSTEPTTDQTETKQKHTHTHTNLSPKQQ